MRRMLWGLVFAFTTLFANESILKLDTKGHTALIKDIIVTKDHKIITASADKSVRVWSKEGREERKILGRIAPGNEGMIFAIALSLDERYLAVAGFMELNNNHDSPTQANYIRIYDYQSGKLLHLLKSHTDVLNDLDFSEDGRYLVSASIDHSVKIWDMASMSLVDTITAHTKEVYCAKIVQKHNDYFIYSTGYDGQIVLYSLNRRRVVKTAHINQALQSMALSNRYIALAGLTKREIYIYDYDLNPIQTIYSETLPSGLAFSPSGNQLVAGTWDSPNNINVYSVPQGFKRTHSFYIERNFTQAVNFIDEETIVAGGWVKDNFKLFIWSLKNDQLLQSIEGVGKYVWGVGIEGNTIGWGNAWSADPRISEGSRLTQYIDLDNFKIGNNDYILSQLKRIPLKLNSYSLTHRAGGNYGYNDATLDIQKDGYTIASITKDLTNGYRHNCYGFYNDKVISGGMHGRLKVYNFKGKEIGDLVGHTGEIWSIALDGDRLVSGSDDQTIRIWNLKELQEKAFVGSEFFTPSWLVFIQESYPKIDIHREGDIAKLYNLMLRDYGEREAGKLLKANALRKPDKLGQAWYDFIAKNYPHLNIYQEGGMKQLYKNLLRDYGQDEANKMFMGEYTTLYPQLSIFVAQDGEWIVWSQSGYYASSINGDQYIGWHINQGREKEARFLSVDKIKGMKRPDVITAILKYGSEAKALERLKLKKVEIDAISPAYIRVLKQEIVTNAPEVTIKFEVEGDAKHFIITQNGALLNIQPKRIGTTNRYKFSVKPESNNDEVVIKVDAQYAVSEEVKVTIKTKTQKAFDKPKLHILSVGVSEYATKLWNLKYADKDAKEFVDLFKGKKELFQEVVPTNLINEEAKRDNILDELSNLENLEISTKDMVIIFLSGHGVNDKKKKYYFLGYDASLNRLRSKGVEWDDFIETIASIKSKIIMIVDTCHSGNIAGDKDFSKAIDAIKAKHRDIAIITASTGDEVSTEKASWQHGALTKAIIEAIKDKKLKTIEAFGEYLKKRVNELTDGKQTPQVHIPESIGKLRINP